MSTLGAMSLAWVRAQASLPNGWQLSGLMRFGEEWLAFSNGPEPDQHIEASGRYAEQALDRLSEALRRKRGFVTGAPRISAMVQASRPAPPLQDRSLDLDHLQRLARTFDAIGDEVGGARYAAVAFVQWVADEYAATGRRPVVPSR